MSAFKRMDCKSFAKSSSELTSDNIYWKKLSAPVLIKEFGPIDYIDFSPIEPHYFAVTSSVRIQVYNPITKLGVKNVSRFRKSAYGGSFQSDGRLLCAGDEEANVKIFDINSKNLLRLFQGHTAAVHRTLFTLDKTKIASFSDDKTVRVWDIPTEKTIYQFSEHSDYIRAGAVNPVSNNIVVSGGYDNICKFYDTRNNSTAFTVDHGSPVESVLFLPSGSIFISAGGTEIRIWDALMGGKLLKKILHHHKTITCLRLAQNGKQFMSSSLDQHVKIYDVVSYKPVHTLDYPNAILSLAVSTNDNIIVAGTVDGLVSISYREMNKKIDKVKKIPYKYVSEIHTIDSVAQSHEKEKEAAYDVCLRKFQFSKALDIVLKPCYIIKRPEKTVAIMDELIRRKKLHIALANRERKTILQILKFLKKYLSDQRFTRVLIEVANAIIDIYQDSAILQYAQVQKMFIQLKELVRTEIELTTQLLELQGALNLLLAAFNVGERTSNAHTNP